MSRAKIQDFKIPLERAESALGLPRGHLILCGRPPPYQIKPDGSRTAWASDIVRSLKLRNPRLAACKLRLALEDGA